MNKTADFRQKEVVNIATGQRLGYVSDVDIDMNSGMLNSIIIPGKGKLLGMFGGEGDIVIPWESVKTIGEDIILVDYKESSVRREAK